MGKDMIQVEIVGRIPSKKNNKRIIKVGGRYMLISSKAWVEFEKKILPEIQKQVKGISVPVRDTCEVRIDVKLKGKVRVDLDNTVSGVLDILQKAGVIEDDNLVVVIQASKNGGHKDFSTTVQVLEKGSL